MLVRSVLSSDDAGGRGGAGRAGAVGLRSTEPARPRRRLQHDRRRPTGPRRRKAATPPGAPGTQEVGLRPLHGPGHRPRHPAGDPDGVGHVRLPGSGRRHVLPLLRAAGFERLRPVFRAGARDEWTAHLRRGTDGHRCRGVRRRRPAGGARRRSRPRGPGPCDSSTGRSACWWRPPGAGWARSRARLPPRRTPSPTATCRSRPMPWWSAACQPQQSASSPFTALHGRHGLDRTGWRGLYEPDPLRRIRPPIT